MPAPMWKLGWGGWLEPVCSDVICVRYCGFCMSNSVTRRFTQALNRRYFFATSSVARWRMSAELAPTMTSNLPGSITRFMSRS